MGTSRIFSDSGGFLFLRYAMEDWEEVTHVEATPPTQPTPPTKPNPAPSGGWWGTITSTLWGESSPSSPTPIPEESNSNLERLEDSRAPSSHTPSDHSRQDQDEQDEQDEESSSFVLVDPTESSTDGEDGESSFAWLDPESHSLTSCSRSESREASDDDDDDDDDEDDDTGSVVWDGEIGADGERQVVLADASELAALLEAQLALHERENIRVAPTAKIETSAKAFGKRNKIVGRRKGRGKRGMMSKGFSRQQVSAKRRSKW